MSEIDDCEANLVCTSPPYNVGVDYEGSDDDLDPDEYRNFIGDFLRECGRILADDGRLAINVGLGVGRPLIDLPRIIEEQAGGAGFNLRDHFIWVKGDSESSSAWGSWRSASCPRQIIQHEHILVFYREHAGRRETRGKTMTKQEFLQNIKSVWNVKPASNSDHPAAYPPEIPRRILQLHSYPGDLVVDPFTGSGTTLDVAEELGRDAIGYDIAEKYVEMSRERVGTVQGEAAVRLG